MSTPAKEPAGSAGSPSQTGRPLGTPASGESPSLDPLGHRLPEQPPPHEWSASGWALRSLLVWTFGLITVPCRTPAVEEPILAPFAPRNWPLGRFPGFQSSPEGALAPTAILNYSGIKTLGFYKKKQTKQNTPSASVCSGVDSTQGTGWGSPWLRIRVAPSALRVTALPALAPDARATLGASAT